MDPSKNNTLTQLYRIQNGHKYTEAEFTSTYAHKLGSNTYLTTVVNNWCAACGPAGSCCACVCPREESHGRRSCI